MEEVKNIGTHQTHCCILHGCKYGEDNCPVVHGRVKQEYTCETCDMERIESVNQLHPPTQKILEAIEAYCNFEEGKAYILMLIPRKKENRANTEKEKLGLLQRRIILNMQDAKDAIEYFESFSSVRPDLKFRVYITVNRRDLAKGLFKMSEELLRMQSDMYNGNKEVFQRVVKAGSMMKSVLCGKACRDTKYFHFDVDYCNKTEYTKFDSLMKTLTHLEETEILYHCKTVNGWAIVTTPFNPFLLKDRHPQSKGMVVDAFVEIKNDSYLFLGMYN